MSKPFLLNNINYFLLRYGFLFVILFCFELYRPNLNPKLHLMDIDPNAQLEELTGSNQIRQLFWILSFLFFSAQFVFFRIQKSENRKFMKLMLALIAMSTVCIASITWSDYPSFATKRSIFQLLVNVTIGLTLYYAMLFNSVIKCVQIASVANIVMIFVSLSLGVGFDASGTLAGYFSTKNTAGAGMLVLIALNLIFVDKGDNKSVRNQRVIIAILVLFLLASVSKTNIAILLLIVFTFQIGYRFAKIGILSLFIVLSLIFIFMPLTELFLGEYIVITDYVEDSFITERGYIWRLLYYDIHTFDKIWMGYGYGSFFNVPQIPYYFDDPYSFVQFINSSHNGYLDLLLQFGVLFSSLIILIFLYLLKSMETLKQCALMLIPLMQNVTESSLLKGSSFVWLLFVVLILYRACTNKYVQDFK